MKINYFDLGLFDGSEIQMFISEIGDREYAVYGFEANPLLCDNIIKKFSENDSVNINNLAISNQNGTEKLYLERSGHGSSIFQTKNNVSDEFVQVRSIVLSEWIKKNVSDFDKSYNILRFNIEGAELYLMRDLEESEMISEFDLFLGSDPDIKKVSEIVGCHQEYCDILERNNIRVLYYCKERNDNIRIAPKIEYHEYLEFQSSKGKDPTLKAQLKSIRGDRVSWFVSRFTEMFSEINNKDVLCLGSRYGEEVEAFRMIGANAIGIDLNPFPPLVERGDMNDLSGFNKREIVYSNSIGHSWNFCEAAKQIQNVLKPDGLTLIHYTDLKFVQMWDKDPLRMNALTHDELIAAFTECELVNVRNISPAFHGLTTEYLFCKTR